MNNGQYDVSYGGAAEGAPKVSPNLQAATIDAFTKNRTATPETESIRGVAVVATSTDHVTTVAAAGGGGTAGVDIAGSAFVPSTTTNAFIGAGANVNQAGGSAGQTVLVAAGADYYHLGVGGALTGAASVAIAPGADVTLATNHTSAYIDSSGVVSSAKQDGAGDGHPGRGHCLVRRRPERRSALPPSPARLRKLSLNDQTLAYIGDFATVDAGGNVLVAARDDSGSSMLDGTAALGFGAVGVGGLGQDQPDHQGYGKPTSSSSPSSARWPRARHP